MKANKKSRFAKQILNEETSLSPNEYTLVDNSPATMLPAEDIKESDFQVKEFDSKDFVEQPVNQELSQDQPTQVDPQLYVIRLLEGIYLNTQKSEEPKTAQDEPGYTKEFNQEHTQVKIKELEEERDKYVHLYMSSSEFNAQNKTAFNDIVNAVIEAFDGDNIDDITIPNKFSFWWVVSNAKSIFTLIKTIVTAIKDSRSGKNSSSKFLMSR